MYRIKNKGAERIEPTSFADLRMQESDIEEILRNSIDLICDDEESMLIVGQQVKNEKNGRSDLTAVDNDGNIVLIEIKRDKKDIESRREPFEFQAVRYAASYATIESTDDLVKKVYVPYIEKYKDEFETDVLTSFELGTRRLHEFLLENNALNNFNKKQKIVLAASDFDEQTLSAVAWLNKNAVDISCYKLIPYSIGGETYLKIDKVLPVVDYSDYYVNLMDRTAALQTKKSGYTKRVLPKIDAMLEWGVVKEGDIIFAKGRENEAILLKDGNVKVDQKEMSMQVWLKGIYGWSSVQTYAFAVHKDSGKTLSQIRQEYMDNQKEGSLGE